MVSREPRKGEKENQKSGMDFSRQICNAAKLAVNSTIDKWPQEILKFRPRNVRKRAKFVHKVNPEQ